MSAEPPPSSFGTPQEKKEEGGSENEIGMTWLGMADTAELAAKVAAQLTAVEVTQARPLSALSVLSTLSTYRVGVCVRALCVR